MDDLPSFPCPLVPALALALVLALVLLLSRVVESSSWFCVDVPEGWDYFYHLLALVCRHSLALAC